MNRAQTEKMLALLTEIRDLLMTAPPSRTGVNGLHDLLGVVSEPPSALLAAAPLLFARYPEPTFPFPQSDPVPDPFPPTDTSDGT